MLLDHTKYKRQNWFYSVLLEIILGPIWAWMFFSELPTSLTMIGGAILLSAILFQTFSGIEIFKKKLQTVTVKTMQ